MDLPDPTQANSVTIYLSLRAFLELTHPSTSHQNSTAPPCTISHATPSRCRRVLFSSRRSSTCTRCSSASRSRSPARRWSPSAPPSERAQQSGFRLRWLSSSAKYCRRVPLLLASCCSRRCCAAHGHALYEFLATKPTKQRQALLSVHIVDTGDR